VPYKHIPEIQSSPQQPLSARAFGILPTSPPAQDSKDARLSVERLSQPARLSAAASSVATAGCHDANADFQSLRCFLAGGFFLFSSSESELLEEELLEELEELEEEDEEEEEEEEDDDDDDEDDESESESCSAYQVQTT